MGKTLSFMIENRNLYLEQILEEYMGVPIFLFVMMVNSSI